MLIKQAAKFDKCAPVSVVIPCFRCAKTINRAIASIAKQTITPAEIILVDDASGDETLETLLQLARTNPRWVRVLSLSANQGAANARNAGWDVAVQPLIAFLDADDAWHAKKIEIQYGYMAAHAEVALSGHAHRLLEGDVPKWDVEGCTPDSVSKWGMLMSNQFITPSVMLKREIPFRFAGGRRHMEDHLLWMEITCAGLKVVKLEAELASIYKPIYGASGLSAQLWAMELGDLQNYRYLLDKGEIGFLAWLGLSTYSIAKFARRLIVTWGYVRWKR